MTALEYHAADGISNSMLGQLDNGGTPAHLRAYLDQPREATLAMEIGTLVHDLVLLGNNPQDVVIKPAGMKFNTTEGKRWKAEQGAKTILTQDEHDSIFGMRDSIMRHPKLKFAIENGDAEQSLFAPCGQHVRKGRLDLVPRNAAALIDFKTTEDASAGAFAKTIASRGYHRQAAYYLDLAQENGLPHTEFLFVAVEKAPPYAVAIYYLDQDSIRLGRNRYRELLEIYIECAKKNEWPAYSLEPQPISLPMWAQRAAA